MKKLLAFLLFLGYQFGLSQIIADTQTYPLCDFDGDGFVSVPFSDLQSYVLDVLEAFDQSPEIYVTKAHRGVEKITHLYDNPQIVPVCGDTDGNGGYYDIAINSQKEIYVSRRNGLLQKMNPITCQYQTIGQIHPNGQSVLALSFDHQDNLYEGGWTSQIFRADAQDLTQFYLWHDFGDGNASGDFVQIGEHLYIAWTMRDGKDHLLKVTLDANNQYVSHQDLGKIKTGTFGLAAEYGRLYGNTPNGLYEIDLTNLSTTDIVQNNNSTSALDWWGAAGYHEALDMKISYHGDLNEAINDQAPLSDPYTNPIAFQDAFVYIRVHEAISGTTYIIPVHIVISVAPSANSTELIECRDLTSGWANFNLENVQSNINTDASLNFNYFDNLEDLHAHVNPLPTQISIANSKTIYAKVFDQNDRCYGIATIDLVVPTNEVNYVDQVEFCWGSQAFLSVPDQYLTYQWLGISPEDADQNLNGPEIFVSQPGIYQLEVQHPNGCTFLMQFETTIGGGPEITAVIQNPDQSITVNVSPQGNYEYSLDGIFWQHSPTFHQLIATEYNIQVRSAEGCYTPIYPFSFLSVPNFISPNGDGKNDQWFIHGINEFPDHQIQIYDRNGKLFFNRKAQANGFVWDGTYLGRTVPSGTYWYIIRLNEEKTISGHLTVKNR